MPKLRLRHAPAALLIWLIVVVMVTSCSLRLASRSGGEAEAGAEWEYGDLAAGFAEADVVIEEHSYHQSLSHQPLESRTTLAYWQGGKLFVFPSVQSTARSVGPMARWAGIGCSRCTA